MSKEILRVFPFGSFDPAAILRLEKSGIFIRLYAAGVRDRPVPPEDGVLIELSRTAKKIYLALIGRKDARLEAEEIPLPSMSLKALRIRLEETRERLRQNEKRLRQFSGDRQVLLDALHHARDRVLFLEARSGMGNAARIAYLQGYFPRPKERLIRETASREGWGFLIEDPGEQDQPPTLIENPRWIRPVEFIFDGIGILPGYRETDISLPFLVFFSLFFSMLVGDAGYGCLFLLLTSLARLRFKDAPRAPFLLMWVMGLGTVAWGVLSGNYFGMQHVHPWLVQWRLDWLSGPRGDENLIFFCFLVGAVHLTLAHLWKLAQLINSWGAAAHLGWVGTPWTMFFLARAVVLEKSFPSIMYPVFSVSVVCILATPARTIPGPCSTRI